MFNISGPFVVLFFLLAASPIAAALYLTVVLNRRRN